MKRGVALFAILVLWSPVSTAAKERGDTTVSAAKLQSELTAADVLFNTRHWDDAIAVYRLIVEQAPAVTVARLRIASALRSKGDLNAAIDAYAALLVLDPENDEAARGLAFAQLEKGDLRGAEVSLTKAAEGRHPTREVFYNLAELKLAAGKQDEAVALYEKAATLDPSWEKPVQRLRRIRER